MLLQSIIAPEPGLFIWTTIIFLVFFFLLRAFAWKPILNMIHEREERIEGSLKEAEEARAAMERLKSDNEALMKEARAERDKLLREANAMRESIIKDARNEAAEAAAQEREKAKQQIEAEKVQALNQIKETAAALAISVSEKILRKQLQDKGAQENYAKQLIDDLSQN
ncbi:MAG: F0F1 ATP synthase subunit B [Bacteroidota bacterium]